MSIRAVAWCLDHSPATGTDLLVLLALADFADEHGSCFPSIHRLAHRARVSGRTAQRALRSLDDQGQIVTEIRGGRFANRYRLTFADAIDIPVTPDKLSPPVRTDDAEASDPADDNMSPQPGQSVTPGVTQLRHPRGDTAMSPEPSYNRKSPLTPLSINNDHCVRHRRNRSSCVECQSASAPKPVAPPWCGTCDPHGEHNPAGRYVNVVKADGSTQALRCPRCHPRSKAATA